MKISDINGAHLDALALVRWAIHYPRYPPYLWIRAVDPRGDVIRG